MKVISSNFIIKDNRKEVIDKLKVS